MAKKKRPLYGKGSVFQRKDGRWVAKFLVEETGKYKLLYAKSEKEAFEKLDKALYEQRQGKLATGPQRKLGDYLEQWLEEVQKDNKLRTSSYVKYKKVINTYINPVLGQVQMQKLTPQQVQAFYNKKRSDGLSPKSISLIHGVLHGALDNAVKWSLVSRNVCDLVSPPKVIRPEIRPLTLDQAQQLLTAARGDRLETILMMALTTGMRRGELLALRWADIDFTNNSLQVSRTVDFIAHYGYVETEPKTASGKRQLALPPFVVEKLRSHRIQQSEQRLKVGEPWQESDLVFTGLQGGYLNPRYILKLFDRLLKKAELPHMRFHDLRHSAATLLLSMGVEMKVIQEILGHSNITMTADVYSHVSLAMQQAAMQKWGRAFGGKNGEADTEAK